MRGIVLGLALGAIFAGVTMAMLMALPSPHPQGDYLIAGGLATMVTMLALFAVLLSGPGGGAEAFFRRRPK